jgi:serine/threonine protein kinase
MDSRLALPANTVLDDSYRIVRVVGSGGFGITYEAEDLKLRTRVALKEYYPLDFGDRDSTMSVKPKSDRHAKTFQWGRSNFLQEARTLARFEHPSIVRVTRVFEANSTAYMVMRFEKGQSLDDWLDSLGRPPTQEELDRICTPLLDALQKMHAENFLHRDIAPDNIIVRPDGTPVLLDFGAARRAVAEMSRTLTGVVKAGYSPHEQYSSDSRLQGPWSDIFALGGTLYRAVTGKTPEEAALRVDEDRMPSATRAAKGAYRPEFLSAIDACLKVRHSERPRSVAQLRPMLLVGGRPQPVREREPSKPTKPVSTPLSQPRKASALAAQPSRPVRRWPAAAAALLAIVGGAYGGYEFMRWQPSGTGTINVAVKRQTPDADSSAQAAADAVRREADIDAERHRQEDARAETQRQADLDAAERRRKEEAETAARRQAEIDAERRRQELAEAQRQADEREAERRRQEEIDRVAAADARRTAEEEEARRKASEPAKVASAVLSADERATFVRQVQEVLKKGRCYEGAVNGRGSADTQEALDDFVAASGKKTKTKPVRIELAKATGADFETWLRDAGTVSGDVCSPPPPAAKPKVAKPAREREEPQQRRRAERQERPRQAAEPREREQPKKFCWGYKNELKEC